MSLEDVMKLNLSAPTTVIFLISLVIALIGLLTSFAIIPSLPISSFWIMTVGYVVLAIGCLFKDA
jgi:predicted membrane channel-forming protein YqfA (hemolysin III family)